MAETKIYPCLDCEEYACDCGRSLQVERVDGGFVLTLVDPEIEFDETVSAHGLSTRIAESYLDAFVVYADDYMNEGGIFLSNTQLADLTAWMEMAQDHHAEVAQATPAAQPGLWEGVRGA